MLCLISIPSALEERGISCFCCGFTAICLWWSRITWNDPFPLLYERTRNTAFNLHDNDWVCGVFKQLNWLLGVREVGCCRQNPGTSSFVFKHVSGTIWRRAELISQKTLLMCHLYHQVLILVSFLSTESWCLFKSTKVKAALGFSGDDAGR